MTEGYRKALDVTACVVAIEKQELLPEKSPLFVQVPAWAVWLFAACFLLIIAVLLLDYCVIRRNALGNTCCTRSRQKRNTTSAVHQKRSTNMLLNV